MNLKHLVDKHAQHSLQGLVPLVRLAHPDPRGRGLLRGALPRLVLGRLDLGRGAVGSGGRGGLEQCRQMVWTNAYSNYHLPLKQVH